MFDDIDAKFEMDIDKRKEANTSSIAAKRRTVHEENTKDKPENDI